MTAQPSAVRSKYDSPMFAQLPEVWEGGNFHMAWFERPDESFAAAADRATAMMVAALNLEPGARVIEAACGVGSTARVLARRGAHVLATNLSTGQIAQARAFAAAEGLAANIDVAVADYHALPCADRTFDVWWCQEALLYTADKARVLDEARRVLKPGGRLLLSDLIVTTMAPAPEIAHLAAVLHAPGFWTIPRYQALFAEKGLRILAHRDGSAHVAPSFARVKQRLTERRERFARVLGGSGPIDEVIGRLGLQQARARDGHLGWAWWVLVV
ncbi:MAG: SAM-dependent methyltransferase [Alphaproteobacteria bacterium]|nr:SAM-dependent methyltransferase [Alphaproteobacteria bacterium]